MLKYVIFAGAVAAPTYVLAADIDMTSITCQELFLSSRLQRRTSSPRSTFSGSAGTTMARPASPQSTRKSKANSLLLLVSTADCTARKRSSTFTVVSSERPIKGNGQTADVAERPSD